MGYIFMVLTQISLGYASIAAPAHLSQASVKEHVVVDTKVDALIAELKLINK